MRVGGNALKEGCCIMGEKAGPDDSVFFCYKAGSFKAIPAFLILSTLKTGGLIPLSSPELSVSVLSKIPK